MWYASNERSEVGFYTELGRSTKAYTTSFLYKINILMKNSTILAPEKHKKANTYTAFEDGSYKSIDDDFEYKIAFSFELEEGEDTQYPLEDLLDKYNLYVSDFLPSESTNIMKIELAGSPEDIQKVASIGGKRVYNSDYTGDDGKTYVKLVIE